MQYVSKELDNIMASNTRWPKWTIKLWDAKLDSINKVALGTATQTPYNISSNNSDLRITRAGGFNASQAQIQVADESLNPENGSNRKFIQHQQIITIDVGDNRVASTMRIFIGYVWGRAGYAIGRGSAKVVSFQAYSREIKYNQNQLTSKLYTTGQNITDIASDYAQSMMGLTFPEIHLSRIGKILQLPTQFVGMKPSEALLSSFFPSNFSAGFDGNGFLKNYDMSINKAPNRVYSLDMRKNINIPQNSSPLVDRITVTGLDADLAYVVQPRGLIASTTATVGWFTDDLRQGLKWSQDGTKRVISSTRTIDGNNIQGITLTTTKDPGNNIGASLANITDYGGDIVISNPSGKASYIALMAALMATYAIPDQVIAAGVGVVSGVTIPYGKIAQGVAQEALSALISQISHGEWTIYGSYYDLVHKEIKHISQSQNLDIYQINNIQIDNQMVNSRAEAKSISNREYYYERFIRSQSRSIDMVADYTLEPYDVIMFEDGRAFQISQINYSFNRGGEANMNINCFALNSVQGAA